MRFWFSHRWVACCVGFLGLLGMVVGGLGWTESSLTPVDVLERSIAERPEPELWLSGDSDPKNIVLKGFLTKTEPYPISLETVLALVDTQNLLLAQSRVGKQAENARFYQKLTDFLPDFYGQYNHTRFNGVVQIFGSDTIKIYQTSIEPRMAVNYRVYPGGKLVFDALAARRRVNASKARVEQTFQEQLSTATQGYYDFLEAQMRLDFVKTGLDEANQQLAVDEARFRVGVGTKLQVMQAKTQVAQRTRELIWARGQLEKAQQALLNQLNLDTDVALNPDPMDAVPLALVADAVSVDTLIHQAVAVHPLVRRLHKEEKALKWDARSVVAEVIPYVDLDAYVSYRGPAYDKLGLNRFGGITARTQLGDNSGLSIPARWLERHRLIQQKQLEIQAAVRTVEKSVVDAYMDSIAAKTAIEAAKAEREAADESYRLSKGRYNAGVGVLLDVLTAQAALNQARADLVQSVMDFNRAQVRLLQATGLASKDTIASGLTDAQVETMTQESGDE